MTINHSIKVLELEERDLTDDLDVLNSINARNELKTETVTKLRNVRASIIVLNEKADSINRYTENGGIFLGGGSTLISGNITVKSNHYLSKPKTKEDALKYLKEHNEKVKTEHIITRLYYNDGREYVQDLSYYANNNYMSYDLLEALKNGQSLTTNQENELQQFIIEKSV